MPVTRRPSALMCELMKILAASGAYGVTMPVLISACRATPESVSRSLHRLRRREWVELHRRSAKRRRSRRWHTARASLTPSGRAFFERWVEETLGKPNHPSEETLRHVLCG